MIKVRGEVVPHIPAAQRRPSFCQTISRILDPRLYSKFAA